MNGKRIFYRLVVGTLFLAVLSVAFTYDSLAYASQLIKTSGNIPQVDIMAVVVDPGSGLTTTEAGDTATFDVYLDAVPPGDVIVTLTSSEINEGTVDPTEMTFTTTNYGDHQTATVTGVDDDVDDGDQIYYINLSSSEGDASVELTNIDNDTAGITVTPTSTMETTEDGDTATFDVELDSQPIAEVTISLSSDDESEGLVTTSSPLTFNDTNWNTTQEVIVEGQDDAIIDGNVAYNIVLDPASEGDSVYDGLSSSNVGITNIDNDVAGITITPTSTMETTEAGGTATFDVQLNTQPTGEVTIGLSSDDETEGLVTTTPPLTFNDTNWNIAQGVTVEGQDDAIIDGNIGYNIVLDPSSLVDLDYDSLPSSNAALTNLDNDASLTLEKTVINDNGGGADVADFQAYIDEGSVPWGVAQIITAGSHTASEDTLPGYAPSDWGGDCATDGSITLAVGEVKTCTITNDDIAPTLTLFKNVINDNGGTAVETDFQALIDGSPVTWNTAQSLTVGEHTASEITLPYYNAPEWSGDCATDGSITLNFGEDLNCTITNDDLAVEFASSTSSVDESTPTLLVPVQLSDISDFEVTVPYTVSGTAVENTDYTITPSPLVIPAGQISANITITVIDDHTPEEDKDIILTMGIPINAFPGTITEHTATILDDDIEGVTIETEELVTSEDGGSITFSVVLDTLPTANVTIALSSSDTTEGEVYPLDPLPLTFTPADWDNSQDVTVKGVDDYIVDGAIEYSIITSPAISEDQSYNGLDPEDVVLTNSDNDSAGWVVAPSDPQTTEGGGAAIIQIKLNTKPFNNVNLTLESLDTTEGIVSPTSITIIPDEWDTIFYATITGVDDKLVDGDTPYEISFSASSSDNSYNGLATKLTVINKDAPTIEWVSPAGNGEVYTPEGLKPITLKVESTSQEQISKVVFRYEDFNLGIVVNIAEIKQPPYEVIFYPDVVGEWIKVFAKAFGPAPYYTESTEPHIWIDRRARFYLLPVMKITQ